MSVRSALLAALSSLALLAAAPAHAENDVKIGFVDTERILREAAEELSGVLDKANKAIKVIAEAEKYDIIFQEVVYRSARIDITEKVLKALADPPATK